MFDNFNFFTPILVFSIINVLLMALPELFCWFDEIADKHSANLRLNMSKINFYTIFSSLLFFVLEIILVFFTLFSNGFAITLQLIIFQIGLFIIICTIPKVLYSLFFYLFETIKFMGNLLLTVFELIITSIAITFFIPYTIFSYTFAKMFKKRNK